MVMSPTVKPVTVSSKVKVTGIGELSVALPAVVEMLMLGFTLSNVRDNVVEAVFPFEALSIATLAAIETSTGPSPVGVISAV